MKKTILYIPILLVFVACSNNRQQSSDINVNNLSEAITPHYSSPKDAAPEIARKYVDKYFSNDCKFENDLVIENTMVTNRFQVMQKFKSNKQGVELSYIYKIFLQYFDGDVNDVSSWEFSQLIVEEMNNGKQNYYNGNLNSRIKKTVGIGNFVNFADVEFKIIDARIGSSISFSHKGKLSRKQIADALKEMHDIYKYDTYHIHHDNNLKEDYIQWQATGNMSAIYDFEKNKIYMTLEDYVNDKAIL